MKVVGGEAIRYERPLIVTAALAAGIGEALCSGEPGTVGDVGAQPATNIARQSATLSLRTIPEP